MSPPQNEEVSLGELARRMERFEHDTRQALNELLATGERRANDFVRKDVYEVNSAAVDREIKEIKAGLRTARAIMWTALVGVAMALITVGLRAAHL